MNSWDLMALELKPRLPEILSSSDVARVIVLDLATGERLSDHQVHERAWLLVVDGEIEVTTAAGEHASGGSGLLVGVRAGRAPRGGRQLLRRASVCCCWHRGPVAGHPGAMTIREKLYARRHAAKRTSASR